MPEEFKIYFDAPSPLEISGVKLLSGIVGLYFIFTEDLAIPYPFGPSRLLYIGMSERKTTGISKRLSNHYEGISGNYGLKNYRKTRPLHYCIINFEMLRLLWNLRIVDLESYFIFDFIKRFGVAPICNKTTGAEILLCDIQIKFNVDWDYFN